MLSENDIVNLRIASSLVNHPSAELKEAAPIDELETQFDDLEKDLIQMNSNLASLDRNYNELVEMKHVLTKDSTFFTEVMIISSLLRWKWWRWRGIVVWCESSLRLKNSADLCDFSLMYYQWIMHWKTVDMDQIVEGEGNRQTSADTSTSDAIPKSINLG